MVNTLGYDCLLYRLSGLNQAMELTGCVTLYVSLWLFVLVGLESTLLDPYYSHIDSFSLSCSKTVRLCPGPELYGIQYKATERAHSLSGQDCSKKKRNCCRLGNSIDFFSFLTFIYWIVEYPVDRVIL